MQRRRMASALRLCKRHTLASADCAANQAAAFLHTATYMQAEPGNGAWLQHQLPVTRRLLRVARSRPRSSSTMPMVADGNRRLLTLSWEGAQLRSHSPSRVPFSL